MIAQLFRKKWRFALIFTMLAMLGACSSTPEKRPQTEVRHSVGDVASRVALRQLGVPYRYGGSTTTGFDCSGLVQFSYAQAGLRMPRTTSQLWSATETVSKRELQPGDLLFFNVDGKMAHVGMYVGGQRFVHAPSSGKTVAVASLTSDYYDKAFVRAGRPR
ncbi:MAG: C40 family peptidase [Gammaproteobacteria bacterium]|nr:C40 family peptidase [Gammaproteobacteria bacterium]